LQDDLSRTNADFENLELIYKNSSCNCDSSCCKNCKTLQEKVLYLVKTVDIISKENSNFENVLTSQRCAFGKSGLILTHKAKTVAFHNLFQTSRKINQLKFQSNRLFVVSTA